MPDFSLALTPLLRRNTTPAPRRDSVADAFVSARLRSRALGASAKPDSNGHLVTRVTRWHDATVEWAQAATIVSALAAFTGLQALWISRALDRVHATLDRLDSKFDHLDGVVLRDHGERIARLEAAHND